MQHLVADDGVWHRTLIMATDPLGNESARVPGDGAVWRIPTAEIPPANRVPDSRSPDGAGEIDPIQALINLGEAPDFPGAGLADQLLA
jgi:hypothetical protein